MNFGGFIRVAISASLAGIFMGLWQHSIQFGVGVYFVLYTLLLMTNEKEHK